MKDKKKINLEGERIVIIGNRPWTGEVGTISHKEKIGLLGRMAYLVNLDNGFTTYVFDTKEFNLVNN